jgi:hypothetical protein
VLAVVFIQIIMKLKIYFKSKNVVTVRNVASWEVGSKDGSIHSLIIVYRKSNFFQIKSKAIVKSIDLNSVDCIVEC